MALDLSGDWQIIDDPITIVYRQKVAESEWGPEHTITYVQQEEVTKQDLAGDDQLQADDSAFHLWRAKLPKVAEGSNSSTGGTKMVPRMGDRLVYSNILWIVRSVGMLDRDANGIQRYRLVCSKSKL